MQKYVAGLLFNKELTEVLLIEKDRPTWQAGFMNAVGGKVEKGETSYAAMHREFAEEVGIKVHDWKKFLRLEGEESEVNFFYSIGDVDSARQMESEEPMIVDTGLLEYAQVVPNIRWIVPMAINLLKGEDVGYFQTRVSYE